jgi:murein L,D-transpeptidase YcbB/YkuD
VKWLTLFLIVFGAACSHLKEPASTAKISYSDLIPDSLLYRKGLAMPLPLKTVYGKRQHRFIWIDSARLSEQGDSLLLLLQQADHFGLLPNDYHVNEIESQLHDSTDLGLAIIDVLLTDGYFSIRHHLKFGRLDAKTFQRKDLSLLTDDAGAELLDSGIGNLKHEFLKLEPRHDQYQMLKAGLIELLSSSKLDSVKLRMAEQISINMERWRLTKSFPSRYLQVNAPSFMMKVVEDDSIYLSSNVIVGKRENATPLLESIITSFVIYPYWHVPRSIAIKELLPAIQYDSNYLAKHNYDVLDKNGNVVDPSSINWLMLHMDNFPYILRQRDGQENTLGIIKFLFNNPYNVYLHDTNGRRLFSRQKRDLSHGCVRVQKATELARYLTKDDDIYITPEDLDQYLSLQQRYQVKVVKPLPLLIQYFTCESVGGKLKFYDDIYKKDSVLNASINAATDLNKIDAISSL